MSYFLVFLVATAAGLGVGLLTIRQGRLMPANAEAWNPTYRDDEPAELAASVGRSKRRLPPDPNPHTRKLGAAGLAGVVVGAAGLIALLAYVLWTSMNGVLSFPQH